MGNDVGVDQLAGRVTGGVTLYDAKGNPLVLVDNAVLPYRPVKQYRHVTDSRDRNVARKQGTLGPAYGGPDAGAEWDTPSAMDGSTVSGEIWNLVYIDPAGKDWTGMDILIEWFKSFQASQAKKS